MEGNLAGFLLLIGGTFSQEVYKKFHCILQILISYAIMPSGNKKMIVSIRHKKNEPPEVRYYFRGFFFFYGEVNHFGYVTATLLRLTTCICSRQQGR